MSKKPYETYVNGYRLFEVKLINETAILIIAQSMQKAVGIAEEYCGDNKLIMRIQVSEKDILLQKE